MGWVARKIPLWSLFFLPAFVAPAWGADRQLYDNARMFTAETSDRANEILSRIKKDYDKDVVVETFASIPDSLRSQFEHQDRREFFENWLRSRAQHYGVNGIFVLICREPGRLELEPGLQTRQKAFTLKDRDDAVKLMAADFRDNKFDAGLIAGLELIDKRLSENLGIASSAPGGNEPAPSAASQTNPTTAPTTGPSTSPALP